MSTIRANRTAMAKALKSLHKPGDPLVLANVHDTVSAEAVAALPSCTALATASYAVALAAGVADDDLTFDTNLAAAQAIGKVAAKHGKPLTVDLQDGYGVRLEEAIVKMIDAGVVGINLEDYDRESDALFSADDAANRVERALSVAKDKGVVNFVVNARCDVLVHGGSIEETIARGKKYLAAGATSVFVWGGSQRGVSREEVGKMVDAFNGALNVSFKMGSADALSVKELGEMGVSRISVGPSLLFKAMERYAEVAKGLLESK